MFFLLIPGSVVSVGVLTFFAMLRLLTLIILLEGVQSCPEEVPV